MGIRRCVLGTVLVVLAGGVAAVVGAAPASAAVAPIGHLDRASQDANGVISIAGWAFDRGQPGASINVDVVTDGHPTMRMHATIPRADVNRHFGITGNHGFTWTGTRGRVNLVQLVAHPVVPGEHLVIIGSAYLHGPDLTAISNRIIAQASRLVGAPYVDGGSGPYGFDCSGYTMYVYHAAGVANLAHNSETQRHQVRIISASQARPGDLIFYMSGGTSYHVAIYAGGGTGGYQYAATVPGDVVKYQHIWSSAIQFGTDWH